MQADILHPLADLHFEACCSLPQAMRSVQCMLLHNRLYVGGGNDGSILRKGWQKLYVSDLSMSSWATLDTPTELYGLTSYCSKLVLVGGRDTSGDVTDQLWVSDTGTNWQSSLPSMPTKCFFPTAVNFGAPECILVAGGFYRRDHELKTYFIYDRSNTFDLLRNGQWLTVQPLPEHVYGFTAALHDGVLYFNSHLDQNSRVWYCETEKLIAQSGERTKDIDLWKSLSTSGLSEIWPGMVSFQQRLVSVGGIGLSDDRSRRILAFSETSQSWVHVGNAPFGGLTTTCLVLPNGDLAIVEGAREGGNVYRVTMHGK